MLQPTHIFYSFSIVVLSNVVGSELSQFFSFYIIAYLSLRMAFFIMASAEPKSWFLH